MQSIVRAQTAVTEGALKLAAEVENASNKIGSEVSTAVAESSETANLVGTSVSDMAEALADAVSKVVSPETIQELSDALAHAANKLDELAENTSEIGPEFAELACQKYDELIEIANETKTEIEGLTTEVSHAVSESTKAFRSSSWAEARDLLDGMTKDALQLGLDSQLEAVSSEFMSVVGGAGEKARQQAAAFSSAQVTSIIAQYSESKIDELIDRAIASIEEIKGFIDEKAQRIFDDLDGLKTNIREIVAGLEAVIERVSAAFDTVDEQLGESETLLASILSQLDAHMDQVESIADTIKQSIEASIAIVDEAATEIVDSFEDVIADIRDLEKHLEQIPSRFDEVIAKVDAAIAFIRSIDPQIDDFCDKSKHALDAAKIAIGEADGLCDDAIETCTKHMAKAPPLMAARTLFQGVKASIPGIISSIDSGYGAVDEATGVAKTCLDEAVKAVDAVYPSVEQARVQAVHAIELVVEKLEQAVDLIHDGQSKLEAGVGEVARLGNSASGKAIQAAGAVREAKDQAIQSVQPEEKLTNVRNAYNESRSACLDKTNEQLETLSDQAASGIDAILTQLEQPLNQVYEKIDEVITLLNNEIRANARQKIAAIEEACSVSLADVAMDASQYLAETPIGKACLEKVNQAGTQLSEFESSMSQTLGISKDMTIEQALRSAGDQTVAMASDTQMGQDLRSQVDQAKADAESLISDARQVKAELETVVQETKQEIDATQLKVEDITNDLDAQLGHVKSESEALKIEVEETVEAANAEMISARESVNRSIESVSSEASSALELAEAERDTGMAAIQEAVSTVNAAKEQTLSAQAEVLKAESIVEQEVAKAGGDVASVKKAAIGSSASSQQPADEQAATAPTDAQSDRAPADAETDAATQASDAPERATQSDTAAAAPTDAQVDAAAAAPSATFDRAGESETASDDADMTVSDDQNQIGTPDDMAVTASEQPGATGASGAPDDNAGTHSLSGAPEPEVKTGEPGVATAAKLDDAVSPSAPEDDVGTEKFSEQKHVETGDEASAAPFSDQDDLTEPNPRADEAGTEVSGARDQARTPDESAQATLANQAKGAQPLSGAGQPDGGDDMIDTDSVMREPSEIDQQTEAFASEAGSNLAPTERDGRSG